MVSAYGTYTRTETIKKSEWCDMDYVANLIEKSGYEPKTSIENVIQTVIMMYECELDDNELEYYAIEKNENEPMINIDDVESYVYDNGGFSEFDFWL